MIYKIVITNYMDFETRMFNAFTRDLEWNLSWAESTQFTNIDSYFLRLILIFSSQLCLGLLKGLFPVGLPVKMYIPYIQEDR